MEKDFLMQSIQAHKMAINSVDISVNGKYIVTGAKDKTIKVWETQTGNLLRTLEDHNNSINALAISPDGQYIASGSQDTNINIWELLTGNLVEELRGHKKSVEVVFFSPDGKCLLSSGKDSSVKIWEVKSGKLLRELRWAYDWKYQMALTPDQKYLINGSANGTTHVFDFSTGEDLKTMETIEHQKLIVFSPDGKYLIGALDRTWANTLNVFNFNTGLLLWKISAHAKDINALRITPNGKYIVTGASDKTIMIWELTTSKRVKILRGHNDIISSLAISSDGKLLVSSSTDGIFNIWDLEKIIEEFEQGLEEIGIKLRDSDPKTRIEAFRRFNAKLLENPEEKTLYARPEIFNLIMDSLNDENTIIQDLAADLFGILEFDQRIISQILQDHTKNVTALSISPDGKTLVSGSKDANLILWDVPGGSQIWKMLGHSTEIRSVAISPDGNYIISGSQDETVKIWTLSTGELKQTLKLESIVTSVDISPDGKFFCSGLLNFTVQLRDLSTGTLIKTLQGHEGSINSVVIASNGNFIASGSSDNTVKIWDTSTGNLIKTLEGHSRSVSSVAISPDCKYLASGSAEEVIKLWDISSGQVIWSNEELYSSYSPLAFSPDGKFVIAGSHDNKLVVLEVTTGTQARSLEFHRKKVLCLGISSNGDYIASGSVDKTIVIWNFSRIQIGIALNKKGRISHKEISEILQNIKKKKEKGTLQEYIKDDIVDLLIENLRNRNTEVQAAAAEALGEIGDIKSIAPLISCLTYEDANVRKAAAVALGKLGDTEAIGPLITSLNDKNEDVWNAIINALTAIGTAAVEPLIAYVNLLIENDPRVSKSTKVPKWMTVGVFNVQTEVDTSTRESITLHSIIGAIKALGKIKDDRAFASIIYFVEQRNYYLKQAGAEAIGDLGDERAIKSLQLLMEDTEFGYNAEFAGEALSKIGSAAVEPLIAFLKHDNYQVRQSAIMALGNIGDSRAIKPLMELLKTQDKYASEKTMVALSKLGPPVIEPLFTWLDAEERKLRDIAASILINMGDIPVKGLLTHAQNNEGRVKGEILKVLGSIPDPQVINLLISNLIASDQFVRDAAKIALKKIASIEPLVASLKDKNWELRKEVARILGLIGNSDAINPLKACLNDENESVRAQAVGALFRLGEQVDLDPIIHSSERVDLLTEFLLYENRIIRNKTMNELLKINDPNIIELLIPCMKDDDLKFRTNAAKALENLMPDHYHVVFNYINKFFQTDLIWNYTRNLYLKMKFDEGYQEYDYRAYFKLLRTMNSFSDVHPDLKTKYTDLLKTINRILTIKKLEIGPKKYDLTEILGPYFGLVIESCKIKEIIKIQIEQRPKYHPATEHSYGGLERRYHVEYIVNLDEIKSSPPLDKTIIASLNMIFPVNDDWDEEQFSELHLKVGYTLRCEGMVDKGRWGFTLQKVSNLKVLQAD